MVDRLCRHGALLTLAALLTTLAPPGAVAHDRSPSALLLVEQPGGAFEVTWSVARAGEGALPLTLALPQRCAATTSPKTIDRPRAVTTRWHIDCGEHGLEGALIRVEGLELTGTDVIARIERGADAQVGILQRRAPAWVVPPPRDGRIPWSYLPIGVEHILFGLDHLLVVLALVWLTGRRWRALLGTLTAFTVGHSLTLAAATLVPTLALPTAAIEALIALSIVALALDMAEHDPREEKDSPPDPPWRAALGIGLLHGLGFAGALAQLGWPEEALLPALLLFNVGVEAGQLIFVAALLAVGAVAGRAASWPEWAMKAPVMMTGGLGVFWTLRRALAIVW